jgi:hypothetical protein
MTHLLEDPLKESFHGNFVSTPTKTRAFLFLLRLRLYNHNKNILEKIVFQLILIMKRNSVKKNENIMLFFYTEKLISL